MPGLMAGSTLLIFVFRMGVEGAALATILSQFLSAAWVLLFLCRKGELRLNGSAKKFTPDLAKRICALGFSPFIMTSTESLLQIVFNRSLLHYGGDLYVATMSINGLLMQMLLLPLNGFAQGSTPITSYNYGARNVRRVRENIRLLLRISFGYSLLCLLAVLLFPGFFVGLFQTREPLTSHTIALLRLYCLGLGMLGLQISCQQSFIAFGQAKISTFLALLRKMILLIPMILILPHFFQPEVVAIYAAEPIADILAALVTSIAFYRYFRELLQTMRNDSLPE